ncbi:DNA polymerase-3 subunit delta' [Paenibacillus sp. V4I3]|jgi:DNA polymerase-3 subunit delta'|uniref:DNA polymerase III subunit delta n=1 Tax=Paenibacillus alginolyticus TaxID=59839 RepID=A0ABT4GF88_9BACL|nr:MULTISPECIES: DNA polymerase III subunit delta' [Paenibacillus]MCY9669244.1 DNA polymerase III subunit delta' [Paenibacillus alginolyticus]MCY9694860.1 DNA polymerase III subunit delta' [Paenibacillus alginolyticus]MDQ0872073.1 DNA polymerase-3 subunit delta' [Paenibacillus sp. V4I3]MEC0147254.1 DNA polymerase III subunit delta' [Paenibacillus alginolyticus]
MSFQAIPGQAAAKQLLQNGLRQDKLSHAYIFSGPVGTGRSEMAIALAKAIYCQHGTDEACGECLECRKVEHRNHPDLHMVTPDGASIKIEQIRELQKEFAYRATASGTKIYILYHADKMTVQAANSLLKFLEEPTSRVVAILITENGNALLPTIQSRAQWINFTPMPREQMVLTLLQEGHPASLVQPAAHLTAGLQAARDLIAANWFAEMRTVVLQLAKETLTRFPTSMITVQQRIVKTELADHMSSLFDLLILWFKDMVQLRLERRDKLVYNDQLDWMSSLAFSRDVSVWVRMMEQAVDLQKRLRFNANSQLVIEKMLVEMQGV